MKQGFGERVARAAKSLSAEFRPRTAVVLGSGLSGIVDDLGYSEVPFASIPEFPKSTVHGHRGSLFFGPGGAAGKGAAGAAIMAGRFHFYEGHSMDDVVLPIFVLREIGVETLVLTNAAGGVNPDYAPGDLVLIRDHINLMGTNPFIGPNPDRAGAEGPFGERFFDMSHVYPLALRELARELSTTLWGNALSEGVYAAFTGPSYETPAEVRMARVMGADLVGMSTVPEAIAARHLGMKVLGISCVTNMAAGVPTIPALGAVAGPPSGLSHAEVVATGKRVEAKLKALILGLIERL